MTTDIGKLQAYLDGALAADERAEVAAHLAGCGSCREQIAMLQVGADQTARLLAALEPASAAIPAASTQLAQTACKSAPGPGCFVDAVAQEVRRNA